MADALRVSIHAGVLAHDVLYGFDEGADGHGLELSMAILLSVEDYFALAFGYFSAASEVASPQIFLTCAPQTFFSFLLTSAPFLQSTYCQ